MRAIRDADHVIFTLVNAKGSAAATLTCSQLHKRAEKVSNLLNERAKVNTGDHVALIFPPGIDLICAFYGCLYVGKSIGQTAFKSVKTLIYIFKTFNTL